MPRPKKKGLDYFSLDCELDDKFGVVEGTHGLVGFAMAIKLYQRIYRNGYWYFWRDMEQILFSRWVNVDINTVREVINVCINVGLYDINVYRNYEVLTSKGIQGRYFTAISRRSEVEVVPEVLLVSVPDTVQFYKTPINVYINPADTALMLTEVHTSWINADRSTQSKVKERKGKERKGNVAIMAADAHGKNISFDEDSIEVRTFKAFEKGYNDLVPYPQKELDACAALVSIVSEVGDPEVILLAGMNKFQELKESDPSNNGFWRKQPFLPSAFKSLWTRIREELRDDEPGTVESVDIKF